MGMNGKPSATAAMDLTAEQLNVYMEHTIQRLDALATGKGIIMLMEALAETCCRRADAAREACKDPQALDFWNGCGHWQEAGKLALTAQWGRGKDLSHNIPDGNKVMP